MTEQEFSTLFDTQDTALLKELSECLHSTCAVELPTNFARQTAQAIEQRSQQSLPITRLLARLEPLMHASVTAPVTFPLAATILGLTIVATLLGQTVLGGLGLGLLGLVILWFIASHFCLPQSGGPHAIRAYLSLVFYAFPLVGALMTAVVGGTTIVALNSLSISNRVTVADSSTLGIVVGIAIFAYLLSALLPSWQALKVKCQGHPLRIIPFQLLHAAWVGVLLSLLALACAPEASMVHLWSRLALVTAVICLSLSWQPVMSAESSLSLGQALRKSLRSLFLGSLPIGLVLMVAYQASLTREIVQPLAYANVIKEVEQWVKQEEAIPASQNGWTVLQPDLTHLRNQKSPLALQMRAGRDLLDNDPDLSDRLSTNAQQWSQARQSFIQALPSIKAAISRPAFSVVATQGFSFQADASYFFVIRSVSQGLASLTAEATRKGKTQEALDYLLINLDWSHKFNCGSLINLMVTIAQESIALDTLDAWVFKTHPSTLQLRQLLAGLQAAEFKSTELHTVVRRDIYLADQALRQLTSNTDELIRSYHSEEKDLVWSVLIKILPRSYWQSERKAYVNAMLAQQDNLYYLGSPSATDPAQTLLFSLTARQLSPNIGRAQAHFMVALTRCQALKTVVALELYRREHGDYPAHLQQLVPTYLAKLPVNMASPKLLSHKPALEYQRQGKAYQLTAQSPVFGIVGFKSRQSFGPLSPRRLQPDKYNKIN